MHRARAFFYVSLGILALGGAFHLGARSATGQPASSIVVGGANEMNYVNTTIALDQTGQIWMNSNSGGLAGPFQLPKAGQVVAIDGWGGVHALVLYADGDDWEGTATGSSTMTWQLRGNLLANGPIPATPTTWGRVKADRR